MKKSILSCVLALAVLSSSAVFAKKKYFKSDIHERRYNDSLDTIALGITVGAFGTVGMFAVMHAERYFLPAAKGARPNVRAILELSLGTYEYAVGGGALLAFGGSMTLLINQLHHAYVTKDAKNYLRDHAKKIKMAKAAQVSLDIVKEPLIIKEIASVNCSSCESDSQRVKKYNEIYNGAQKLASHFKDVLLTLSKEELTKENVARELVSRDKMQSIVKETLKTQEDQKNLDLLASLTLECTIAEILKEKIQS